MGPYEKMKIDVSKWLSPKPLIKDIKTDADLISNLPYFKPKNIDLSLKKNEPSKSSYKFGFSNVERKNIIFGGGGGSKKLGEISTVSVMPIKKNPYWKGLSSVKYTSPSLKGFSPYIETTKTHGKKGMQFGGGFKFTKKF